MAPLEDGTLLVGAGAQLVLGIDLGGEEGRVGE
jgi:hypothetical protein